MKGTDLLCAMSCVDTRYLEEMGENTARRKATLHFARYASLAACLALLVTVGARMGQLWGNGPQPQPPVPPVLTNTQQPEDTPDLLQPPVPQTITINWDGVAVNESAGLGMDATRLYRDPELYEAVHWDLDQIRAYYGWELAPAYIPEGLTGGGNGVSHTVFRDKATGEIIEDQAARGFWTAFHEDGSPKSDDDLYIPRGFTVTASRLGILHCGLLPVDDSRTTDFGGVPVTISHCSMPHGPFDPTRKAPDGLSNMPAGYYDIYVAAFELDGVEYEVEAQRLELEELIKIVASIINTPYSADFTVGKNLPASSNMEDRSNNSAAGQSYRVGEPQYEDSDPQIEGCYDDPTNPGAKQSYSVGEPRSE